MTRRPSKTRTTGHASASAPDADDWLEGTSAPDAGETVPMRGISRADLARLMAVPPKEITRLAREGMPQAGRGQFDLPDLIQWFYSEREREGESDPLTAARQRKAEAEARRLEWANRKAEGEFYPADEVHRAIDEAMANLRQEILTIPASLVEHSEEVRAAVKAAIIEKINAMSLPHAGP